MTNAIDVSHVSKTFRYVALERTVSLKDALVKRLFVPRDQRRRTVQALKDVSFSVGHGQMLGIVGRNGSGKSTLMRLLAGVFPPNAGTIAIDGTLTPLLSLGAGFHPDLTGYENARVELLVLGFSPKEAEAKLDAIRDFSEIGGFMDAPVRTYSAGMVLRLAFAVAFCVDPDILLLDEVLAVGDELFAQKCLTAIEGFKERGKTIVLVSHSIGFVERWCDVALWLERGEVHMFGEVQSVLRAYAENHARAEFG
jgi:lipopolysaccharide transport system ATP-binding protein